VGELFNARAAPGSPEIDEHDLAMVLRQDRVIFGSVDDHQLDFSARGSGRIGVDPAACIVRHRCRLATGEHAAGQHEQGKQARA
jgi:hypothetical protein